MTRHALSFGPIGFNGIGGGAILLLGSELAGVRLSCDSFWSVYAQRDLVEEGLRAPAAEKQAEPAPPAQVPARVSPASVMHLQRLVGNQAVCRFLNSADHRPAQPSIDVLTTDEGDDGTGGEILDRVQLARNPDGGAATATAAPDAGAPAATAVPTNLRQIVTSWTPGASKYGFQVKFQCSSSSGAVADLQTQAPNLVWREYVTYSRNDFSHRISPPSPTIMPAGGVSFSAATTTVVGPNLLEFNTTRDTHWMPTSAIRAGDFKPLGTRDLPGVMRSTQLYQFSTDNSTWTNFAGPFDLTRTLERASGPPAPDGSVPLVFTTEKAGVHTVTEMYKP